MGAKETYSNDFERGKRNEREFKALMLKNGKVEDSTEFVDMNDHIDQFVYFDLEKVSVDVKGLKKINKWDSDSDDSKHYVEETNVNGKPGWLNGKADYIAFQTNDHWVIVDRLRLVYFILLNCTDKNLYETKKLYKRYGRLKWGKKDTIILVETKKLKDIATWVLDRDKTYVDQID